jgi:protein SCO1
MPHPRGLVRCPLRAACLALGIALVALACGPSSRVYDARGVVRDVQPEYGQVVIAHEDIPGLMPAMTMNFDVPDPALLARLERGQRIAFRVEFTGRAYRVVDARVLDAGSAEAGDIDARVEPAEPAPPFHLVDQDGKWVSLADLEGRAVLLDFVYTRCPGPCPILTGRQVEVQRALAPDVREHTWFVSISLDPAYDTPEVLREYARARGADLANWSFLTGPVDDVAAVLRAYGVGSVRADDGTIDHRVVTFLIDPEGRIAQRYPGLEDEPDALARDVAATAGVAGGTAG